VAPIAGRAGLRQVDPGNWVRTSDPNGIVTITQLAPISALFSVPEDRVPALMKRLREGARLGVAAYDRAGSERLATGTLLTVDNQIDPATGTVKLKAVFANEDERLFPNQFVNVRMVLEVQRGATVIDEAAVQRGARGTFVYAVNGDQTVTLRPVSLGAGQNGQVAVLQGLKAHELVVIDGADRLSDGTAVELVGADGPPLAGEEAPREKRRKKRDAGTPAAALDAPDA
jgi:multidrug efflux system membrane fusion protein